MAMPKILQKAAAALDFIGIEYTKEFDSLRLVKGGEIWTESGRHLKTSPNGALIYLEAIIKKMEVENG